MRTSRIDVIAKQDQARAMYADGHSWQEVADELGYADRSGAYRAALESARRDPVKDRLERVDIEDARLEWLIEEATKIYRRHHYVVAGKDGDVIKDPTSDEPLDDDGPKLDSLKLIKALSESRRKLHGLDAPTRKVIETVPSETLEAEIARLEASLGEASQ